MVDIGSRDPLRHDRSVGDPRGHVGELGRLRGRGETDSLGIDYRRGRGRILLLVVPPRREVVAGEIPLGRKNRLKIPMLGCYVLGKGGTH